MVRALLDHGADPNVQVEGHSTLLIAAVLQKRQNIISTLLEKGANSRATDRDGKSALLLAAENGLTSIVHLLLKKGTHPDQQDTFGNSASFSVPVPEVSDKQPQLEELEPRESHLASSSDT